MTARWGAIGGGVVGVTALVVVLRGTGPVIAAANFDDGTPGPFTSDPSATVSILDDPTGASRGKVAQFRYHSTVTPAVASSELVLRPPKSLGLGSTFYFGGDLYFPDTTFNFDNPGVRRSLLLYQASVIPNFIGPDDAWVRFELWGKCGFQVNWSVSRKMGMSACRYGSVQMAKWLRIETQVTMNKTIESHDGVIRLWVDGTKVFEDTTVRFSDPAFGTAPSWRTWAIGTDRQSADAMDFAPDLSDGPWFDEIRYWDDVAFTTVRRQAPQPGSPASPRQRNH